MSEANKRDNLTNEDNSDGVMDETVEDPDDVKLTQSQIDLRTENGGVGSQYQGRWTQEEHDKFIEGLKMFGKDWRRIEEYIGSRSCA